MSEPTEKRKDEMPFLRHLEVLRWHIVRSLIALLIGTIFVFVNKYFVFDHIILAPKNIDFITYKVLCALDTALGLGERLCLTEIGFKVINIDLTAQFLMHIKVSFTLGFLIASPYVFWELWRFLKPGLQKKERRYSRGMVFYLTMLFAIGVAFGYYILTPFSINFLGNYNVSGEVANTINLKSYIGTLTSLVLASGIIFELPMMTYFLSKIGLITPSLMRKYRKHALIIILILSGIITPPDIASQVIISFPLYFLYEISIFISARVTRRIERESDM